MRRLAWNRWSANHPNDKEEKTLPEVESIHAVTQIRSEGKKYPHETMVVYTAEHHETTQDITSLVTSTKIERTTDSPYLSALLEFTKDIIIVLTQGGFIQYASSSVNKILGYDPTQLLRKTLWELVHPEDRASLFDRFCLVLRAPREEQSCTFRFWNQFGYWRNMEGCFYHRVDSPMIGGVVLSIQDRTEQNEIEERLHHSEAKNRALLEAIPDVMFFLDRSGRVNTFKEDPLQWIPPVEDYSQREQFVILSPHEMLELARQHTQQVFQSQSSVLFECRLEISPQHRDYEVRIVPGTHQDALVIVRDITEKNRLQSELLRANRMAELGTLVASMGHEINNPLAYIINHLEEMYEQLQKAQESAPHSMIQHLRELTRESLEGSQRIAKLVKDLKSYVREEKLLLHEIDVHQAIDNALHMAGNQIHHRAHLHRDYQPIPYIQGEPGRLEQVFLNLLINAAQALPQSSERMSSIRIQTSYHTDDNTVHVSITDTGMGIAPEDIDRIFEPFFTTKPIGSGTGLGLFVCRNIILKLGGTLRVTSQINQGTTMTVVLPASNTHLYTPAPSQLRHREAKPHQTQKFESSEFSDWISQQNSTDASASFPRTNKQSIPETVAAEAHEFEHGQATKVSILIVDDEPRVAQSLRRILREHNVTIVNTGQEAIEQCLSHDFRWIFCDLSMPDLSGQDVFVQVCKNNPMYRERFVFMTGGVFTEQTRHFCETTDRPVLEKPFDRTLIRNLIAT